MKTSIQVSSILLLFISFAFVDITPNQVIIGTGDICGLEDNPDYSLVLHGGKAYKDDGSMWATPADSNALAKTSTFNKGLEFLTTFQPIQGIYKKSTPKAGQNFVGFHAAEFAKHFPENVTNVPFQSSKKGDEETVLVADPSVLPYITINAVKELNERTKQLENSYRKIAELEKRIENLATKIEALPTQERKATPNPELSANLGQSFPNPAYTKTSIPYRIPLNSTSAQIRISNAQGQVIRSFELLDKGNNILAVNLEKLGLDKGTYFYNLIVNGEVVAARSFVLI